jgi:uncharacterized protein YodC (DUF2158 family)
VSNVGYYAICLSVGMYVQYVCTVCMYVCMYICMYVYMYVCRLFDGMGDSRDAYVPDHITGDLDSLRPDVGV